MVRLAYTPSEESLPCRSRPWSWFMAQCSGRCHQPQGRQWPLGVEVPLVVVELVIVGL